VAIPSKFEFSSPCQGRDGHAPVPGGLIATLIEAAKRQEALIEALTAAVDGGNEKEILSAAHSLAANRRRKSPAGNPRGQKQ